MFNMGTGELSGNFGNELHGMSGEADKLVDMKEMDKPIAFFVKPSEERLARMSGGEWTSPVKETSEVGRVPEGEWTSPGKETSEGTHMPEGMDGLGTGDAGKAENMADREVGRDSFSGCPIEGHGGSWEGERGNSTWRPDRNDVPKNPKTNPEGKTWGQILDKYGIDGIPFRDGEPDFSSVSKGTVQIDNFTENRYGKGGNFDQACEKLAEQRGCTKEEVKQWMKENGYTWHERSDCRTMDKVPTEVHGNIRHEGGISEKKSSQSENTGSREVQS